MLNPPNPPAGYQWHLMPDGNWELIEIDPKAIPLMHEEDFE